MAAPAGPSGANCCAAPAVPSQGTVRRWVHTLGGLPRGQFQYGMASNGSALWTRSPGVLRIASAQPRRNGCGALWSPCGLLGGPGVQRAWHQAPAVLGRPPNVDLLYQLRPVMPPHLRWRSSGAAYPHPELKPLPLQEPGRQCGEGGPPGRRPAGCRVALLPLAQGTEAHPVCHQRDGRPGQPLRWAMDVLWRLAPSPRPPFRLGRGGSLWGQRREPVLFAAP